MRYKVTALLLAAISVVSLLSGCNDKEKDCCKTDSGSSNCCDSENGSVPDCCEGK